MNQIELEQRTHSHGIVRTTTYLKQRNTTNNYRRCRRRHRFSSFYFSVRLRLHATTVTIIDRMYIVETNNNILNANFKFAARQIVEIE